ncbi:MAG: ATP-binding domain-containing protein, partial [bacterium]|nr:ATP-binding domain-containing protein [bacterium]
RFMILAALRKGNFGVTRVNETVERMLIERKMITKEGAFYDHRPIVITSNDYAQKLFNGDTGILLRDERDGRVKAWFSSVDGTLRSFLPSLLPPHATAWAITVHKSQGSEYDTILIVLPPKDSPVLSRELIYTGITRARKKVRIAAKDEVLETVLKRSVRRVSGLVEAIQG